MASKKVLFDVVPVSKRDDSLPFWRFDGGGNSSQRSLMLRNAIFFHWFLRSLKSTNSFWISLGQFSAWPTDERLLLRNRSNASTGLWLQILAENFAEKLSRVESHLLHLFSLSPCQVPAIHHSKKLQFYSLFKHDYKISSYLDLIRNSANRKVLVKIRISN